MLQEKNKADRIRKSNIDTSNENEMTEIADKVFIIKIVVKFLGMSYYAIVQETRKSVRPRKSVMVEPTKENEISIKEKVLQVLIIFLLKNNNIFTMLQEKSKPVRPRMSLPANFPVGQAGTNNENTVQVLV